MSALRKPEQNALFQMRVSKSFKQGLEKATVKANLTTASEFVRLAIIKAAAECGVKIDRLK
jgi:hypothetical protein